MKRVRATWALSMALAIAAAIAGAAHGQHRPTPVAPRSAIVFPVQRITLRMSHALPAHRALACVRCHVAAAGSRSSRDLLTPPERACLPCHAAQITREAPSAARCGTCHAGYGVAAPRDVPVSHFPTPRIAFSHASHVSRGMRCVSCHEGVPDATVATRAHLPSMRSCFRCHGGATPSAPTACITCHAALPDGRMRTAFPEGRLEPPSWLGMQHDADWLVRHRWVAADRGDDCASCHRESDCTDCHDGRVRPPRVHPNDFLTTHPPLARRGTPRCTSCHVTQSFCLECHSRLGVSQISAPLVRPTQRFHPPDELWVRGPVMHAREARRSLESCASCHAERDCVACHGALGIGSGVSPHPPSFRAHCSDALRQNARACTTCHGDASALAARCP